MRISLGIQPTSALPDLGERAERKRTKFLIFRVPGIHQASNFFGFHTCERPVAPGRETQDAAHSALGFGHEQTVAVERSRRCARQQGRVVVVKAECTGVERILVSARSRVAWTQVAFGIVQLIREPANRLNLSQPGPGGPLRGNDDSITGPGVEATVAALFPFRHGCGIVFVHVDCRSFATSCEGAARSEVPA